MTFSEYAIWLSPYISFGDTEADYFTELIGNFIEDAAMDSCVLLKRKTDTKYRYIKGNRQIQLKDAQYLYNHRDIKKFSLWIEERMGDTDSYDKIEEWLNQNGMTPEFVPTACAELLEEIILDIITPTAEGESDVSLPAAATLIEAEHDVSQSDMELLIQFQSDYDKIIKSCISENYANVWISGNISKTIHSLYTGKWETLSGNFQNLTLRSVIIGTLGLLQQLCDILDPNTKGTTITAFRPSVRTIRLKLRNNYVKLHPNEYAGVFPYEAFVPDWNEGEDY